MADIAHALQMFNGQTDGMIALNMAVQRAEDGFKRLSEAIENTVKKVGEITDELQAIPQIAKMAAQNLKAPFDSAVKVFADTMLDTEVFSKLWDNPQNILLSLTVGVVWEVLGDDILSLLAPVLDGVRLAAYGVGAAIGFIRDNFSFLDPVIWGVVAALAVYKGILLITKGLALAGAAASVAGAAAQGIWAGVKMLFAKATWADTQAIWAQTGAQMGLNAAMAVCPLTWIVLGIIAVIAAIYGAVALFNKLAGTSLSATGIICGAFAGIAALIWNVFIGALNAVLQFIWTMFAVPIITIMEFIFNAVNGGFDGLLGVAANAIGQISSWVLSLFKIATKVIDVITGADTTGFISGLQDSLLAWGKNDNAFTMNHEMPVIGSRIEYEAAKQTGYAFGQGIDDNISNILGKGDAGGLGALDSAKNMPMNYGTANHPDIYPAPSPAPYSRASSLDLIYNNTMSIAEDTAIMSETINYSQEDLRFMRDMAERGEISRVITNNIKIEQHNENHISSNMDLDRVTDHLSKSFEQCIVCGPKGVFM